MAISSLISYMGGSMFRVELISPECNLDSPEFVLRLTRSWVYWALFGLVVIISPVIASAVSAYYGKLLAIWLVASPYLILFLVDNVRILCLYKRYNRLRKHTPVWLCSPPRKRISLITPYLFISFTLFVTCLYSAIITSGSSAPWRLPEVLLLLMSGVALILLLTAISYFSPQLILSQFSKLYRKEGSKIGVPKSTKRIVDSICRKGVSDSSEWRCRDDFPQQILRFALCEIFFKRNDVRNIIQLRRAFFIWFLSPITISLLVLLLGPLWLYMSQGNIEEVKPGGPLTGSIVSWAAWSIVFYKYIGEKLLSSLYSAPDRNSTLKLRGIALPRRGDAESIEYYFRGRGLVIVNLIAIGVVPTYLQIISTLY